MLSTFERGKYSNQFDLFCFDRNFDHPHVNVVMFVPRKQSKKPQFFLQSVVFCRISLQYVSAVRFTQNRIAFHKNCYLIDVSLKK